MKAIRKEDGTWCAVNDDSDILQHYGVMGMKWGVWNSDTAARYRSDGGLKLSSKNKFGRKTVSETNADYKDYVKKHAARQKMKQEKYNRKQGYKNTIKNKNVKNKPINRAAYAKQKSIKQKIKAGIQIAGGNAVAIAAVNAFGPIGLATVPQQILLVGSGTLQVAGDTLGIRNIVRSDINKSMGKELAEDNYNRSKNRKS